MTGIDLAGSPAMQVASLASFLGFGLYLAMLRRPQSLLRTSAKTISVLALAGVAGLGGGPALLIAALLLSSMGDAFLAHEGDVAFLGGLGSFMLAHVLYVVLFLSLAPEMTIADLPGLIAVAAFALGIGTAMVRRAGTLAFPVALYVLAIAGMGAGGVLLGGLVLAGAALFMASDAILGSEKFLIAENSSVRRLTAPAVWILYYFAQVLITLGLLV
ncbi:MAG: lysoplasmalogenase family protein [Hoeflea sp.]|uniref:lysoplasmalogenase family protein n=1 Tax=Hoeflea sp. TaxID=1940281 RepID=UPI0032EB7BF3